MKNIKIKHLIILFILGTLYIFLSFIIGIKNGKENSKKDSDYYKSVGLELSGIIKEVTPLKYGHDYGIISLTINQSNIKEYDKRDQLQMYLGVIKNKKADLVFNRIHSVKVGDSIVLKIQNYKLYRNKKLIIESIIDMPPYDNVFSPFREIDTKIKEL